MLAGDDARAVLPTEALFGPCRQPRADTVSSAQCIAAGEDEASNFGLEHGKSYKSNRGPFDSLRSLRMTSIECGESKIRHALSDRMVAYH